MHVHRLLLWTLFVTGLPGRVVPPVSRGKGAETHGHSRMGIATSLTTSTKIRLANRQYYHTGLLLLVHTDVAVRSGASRLRLHAGLPAR